MLSGAVFGRNLIRVENTLAFQAALCEVVRDAASADTVAQKHDLK